MWSGRQRQRWIRDGSYAAPVPIGGTMEAGAVGEVIASNSPHFKPGDFAFGMLGWASHGCLPAKELRKLDPAQGPITAALGVLGMPGFTGWPGLTAYGRPEAGETLVVAAATGPVGSMVGQLAKAKGLRGSAFNPFGYHAEARLHRDLLDWYEAAMTKVARAYGADRHDTCADILAAPMEIRGYGPVRMEAAAKVRQEVDQQLGQL